ncbi:MAG: prepilin-type N-terminal cleavage/methylation domain-containing protein [Kiloniellaceae bacterium]
MSEPTTSSSIGSPGASTSSADRARRPAGGFTLLEVIVAFTILAVALVSLMQAFSSGLRGLDAAQVSALAVMHARSKIDEIGSVIPLEAGERAGDFEDGFRWTATIRRREGQDDESAGEPDVVAYEVEVTVASPDERVLSLKTLRLAAPQ